MASEEYKESDLSKIVKRLMDEEGFEFGEAVKEAMEQTKNFESKANGGSIGIEVLFTDKMKNGGRAGSTMKPKRGLVNEPGGYAGLTTQQIALLNLQLQNDPEFQTGYYKATPELEFQDFYKAPTGPLGYVNEVKGSSSYFDENLDGLKFEPKGPLRDLDQDRTMGIINALDIKDPSGELGFNYIEKLKTTPDGGIYETMQTNTPKFAEFQQIPEDQITKDMTPTNFKNLGSTVRKVNGQEVYGYTTLPDISPSEYGTKFQTETNPVYLNKDLAEFITTKPMSPANQLPLYSDKVAQLGFYGAKPVDLMNQAIDTVQHEYTHNITKFPEFADVIKKTMDAGIPSGLQLKGKPGDGISKYDKEELFTRAIDIERRFNKDGTLNSPNVENDIAFMNQVLNKKYRNLNKDGQSMAIQYLNAIRPQVKDYFNVINQRATANRARTANPDVYASADKQGFTDGKGGGFGSKSTGTNEAFGNKTGRGRTGYDDGGRVGLFMGGPALEGQALSIYNSMNAYGFDDQAIANALTEQGLYTAGGTTDTPETTAPNIINQQLQTGGGGDNNFGGQGIGAFGNLDPNTKQTMQVEMADGMGGVTIKEVDTYLDAGGLRKTLDNKNPVNAGIDIKPMAVGIIEALMGKKTDDEFDPAGKIYGTFNNPNYKNLSFFGKIKADYSRQKELKQLQKEFELQEKLKEQIKQEAIANANKPYSGPTFYNTRDDGSRGSAISQDFQNTTASLDNYSADVLYKDGGLATMFTRRR